MSTPHSNLVLRSATFVRSLQRLLRLSLLPLLLVLLPLQGWAGVGTPVVDTAAQAVQAIETVLATTTAEPAQDAIGTPALDCGAGAPMAPCPFTDAGEAAPSGADLAEQLLLPSAPAMAAAGGRAGPPAYAALRLPEPHLPLLPRPPRG